MNERLEANEELARQVAARLLNRAVMLAWNTTAVPAEVFSLHPLLRPCGRCRYYTGRPGGVEWREGRRPA